MSNPNHQPAPSQSPAPQPRSYMSLECEAGDLRAALELARYWLTPINAVTPTATAITTARDVIQQALQAELR